MMILCAAIKVTVDGNKTVVVPGHRHPDCYALLSELQVDYSRGDLIEGFIDNNGNFMDRFGAFSHAVSCGQPSETTLTHKREYIEFQLYIEGLQ